MTKPFGAKPIDKKERTYNRFHGTVHKQYETDPISCSLCSIDFKIDDTVFVEEECAHAYHQKCVEEWFKKNDTCPVCNKR